MSSFNHNEEKFVINRDKINIIKRTLENNTHEVLEDKRLKSITSWRKSKSKFNKILIFNIMTFGILHWVALHYPLLYIKLYCNPWPAKECDFFLVENIYGQYTLCPIIHRKPKNQNEYAINSEIIKEKMISPFLNNINSKSEYNITKNLTYSFKYKSMDYEYNIENNEIIPVYMDLSRMTNKEIINFFAEGISSYNLLKIFEDRYGKNEYQININLRHLYFKKVELPSFIIMIFAGIIELILKDYFSFISKIIFIILIVLYEYIFDKYTNYNLLKNNNMILGDNTLKVKRKYLIKDNDEFYAEIKNKDLLPGDILFLKLNDIVPCDCLIIEGECIVNQKDSTGNLNIFKKTYLINNKERFNYRINQINILFHGMKILKTFSKIKDGYISVICLNIGSNTFQANHYSNILYLFERNKANIELYKFIGDDRKSIFIGIICLFFLSIILGVGYTFLMKMDIRLNVLKKLVFSCLLRVLFKSIMPVYFITHTIILITGINNLKKQNIFCFDKCRLLHSHNIETIFLSKTNIICNSSFEINSFNSAYINDQQTNNISLKTFNEHQHKEMNAQLLKYYKDYLYNNSIRNSLLFKNSFKNMQYNKNISLFVECLLSCNNIEKINNEIFGNDIETKLFHNIKWDIKTYDYNLEYDDKNNQTINSNNIYNNKNYTYSNTLEEKNLFKYNNNLYIIDRKISDIFPKNYYKLTESLKKYTKNLKGSFRTRDNNISLKSIQKNPDNPRINRIMEDISKTNINSYKLRIYKKFIKDGTLISSSIVYNFITKELRFMTKGIPEDIINKCDSNSLPENIEQIITFIRINGFIILICATKLLNLEEYDDSLSIDYYMNNLTFCGFITLKNQLKNEIKKSIDEIKEFNCNLIINSGDNIYNCLSAGFNSCVIDNNKNIFAIDINDINKILIYNVLELKNINEKSENNKSIYESSIRYSNQTSLNQKSEVTLKRDDSYNSYNFNTKKNVINIPNIAFKKQNEKRESQNPISIDKNKKYYKKKTNISENEDKPSIEKLIQNSNILSPRIRFKNRRNEKRKIQKIPSIDLSIESENKKLIKESNKESKKSNKSLVSDSNNKKSINNNNNINNNQKNIFSKKRKTNFEIFLQHHYYYPRIFQDYEDLSNSIYCVNGKAFNFLYKNRNKKEFKYLLQKIHKNTKIFYNMSAIDKSLSVDFFREYKNNCICFIGKSDNDYDAMISSNIGLYLDTPKYNNSNLCHFYSNESNIISIKNIILEGKAIQENIVFLKIASIFCTMVINSFILCCFICHIEVMIGQLNLLETGLIIFSITAFNGKSNNIKNHPFRTNRKIFTSFYIIQLIGLFLIKLVSIYLLCSNHNNGPINDLERNAQVFCTFYFILCLELIFSSVFIFNYNSFYRKNIHENTFFIIVILIFIAYMIILLTLNSSNFSFDIFHITYFEYFNKLLDSYSDRNKILTFNVFVVDFLTSFIYSRIIFFIFNKKSKNL